MTYNEIVNKVSKELNLPRTVVDKSYKSFWIFIRNTIKQLPLKDNLNEEEFSKLRTSFNIPTIGKLFCTYNRFINTKENKLEIPVNEIDNIYIWNQVSNTQEILLSSKKYFQLITRSFREEVKPVLNVLNDKIPSIKESSYTFADYLSFKLNNHVIFNKSTCFCYMTNTNLLNSLICYIAHTKNKFNIEEYSRFALCSRL